MADNLLACPFCGGEAKVKYWRGGERYADGRCYYVECADWRCPGKTKSDSQALAIAAWNTRHDHTADLLEACEAASRCFLPFRMEFAQAEMADEPVPEGAVVMAFMGSGASDQVTAAELRAALAKLTVAISRARGTPDAADEGVI